MFVICEGKNITLWLKEPILQIMFATWQEHTFMIERIYLQIMFTTCEGKWSIPNSSKDPNVGPSKKHRKEKESGHAP